MRPVSRSAARRRARPSLAALLLLVLLCVAPEAAHAEPGLGIDGMAPIDGAGRIAPTMDAARLHATGARWVRLNFILGPWSEPTDPTLHQGRTWLATYDVIVNALRARGLQVYGLIGAEAVGDPGDLLRAWPGPDPAAAEEWLQQYTQNFVAIVDHFKDRVRVFESFNEPNDWAGGETAKVHPGWFARLLQGVYLETKSFAGHAADPAWQVTLVSGPLFTHDDDDGRAYLAATWRHGRESLAWDWTRAQTGSFPLDGIGMHLYVRGGSTDPATVRAGLTGNLDAVWSVVAAEEGADTPKRLWVSEMGWSDGAVGAEGQAANLTVSLAHLGADPRVALASWFCLGDFPGGDWGLDRLDGTHKPAWAAYRAFVGPPVGTPASLTGGAGPARFGDGRRTVGVTPVNTWRSAAAYWGMEGIDRIGRVTDAGGERLLCAVGLHTGDRVEYRMQVGGRWSRLELRAIADRPGPVRARVYVDGTARGTVTWSAATNRAQIAVLRLPGIPLGAHSVAVEFANDAWTGEGDGDRNLYLERLRAAATE